MGTEALCGACKAHGRRLSPLGDARAAHARQASGQDVLPSLELCWECRTLVDKSLLFCERVRRSTDLLTELNKSSASTFGTMTKVGFDYKFFCLTDINSVELDLIPQRCSDTNTNWEVPILSDVLLKNESMQDSPESIDKVKIITKNTRDCQPIGKLEVGVCAVMKDLAIKPQQDIFRKLKQIERHDFTIKKVKSFYSKTSMGPDSEHVVIQVDEKENEFEKNKQDSPSNANDFSELSDTGESGLKGVHNSFGADETAVGNINKKTKLPNKDVSPKFKSSPQKGIYKFLLQNPDAKILMSESGKISNRDFPQNLNQTQTDLDLNFKVAIPSRTALKSPLDATSAEEITQNEEIFLVINTESPATNSSNEPKAPAKNHKTLVKEKSQTRKKPVRVRSTVVSEEKMLEAREEMRNSKQYKTSLFKCETCILGFLTTAFLEEHNESKHNPVAPHVCDICAERYVQALGLADHRLRHFQVFACTVCGFEARRAQAVWRHGAALHDGRTYACDSCDKEFLSSRQLDRHEDMEHSEPSQCPHCGKLFRQPGHFRTHLKEHSGVPEYECAVCHKRLRRKSYLARHVRAHVAPAPEDAYCAECGAQYADRAAYRAHVNTSSRHVAAVDRRYPCDKCDKRFTLRCYLKSHYDVVHLNKHIFKCDACDKNFVKKDSLKRHIISVHEGVRKPKDKICDTCNRGFTTNTQLKTHRLIHTGERPLTCDICGDTFRQRAALHTHRRLVHLKLKKTKKA